MNIVDTFDPSLSASGTFNTSLGVGGRFVAFNESNIGVMFTFADGSTAYLPSWTTMIYIQPTPDPTVTWTQQNIIGGTPGPISTINIEAYNPGETVSGVYPFSLIRQLNVANLGVVTNVATATSIQNDNNGAGTSIIEATVTGSPQSNVTMDNSGNFALGEWTGGVFTKNLQVIANATPSVKIAAIGHSTEILGSLTVDGASTLTGNVQCGGTLGATGNTTLSGTLAVTSTASFHANGVTIDSSNNVNCNAVNTNTINTGIDNVTTINATTINTTGNIIQSNNQAIQWKDSGGTARKVLNVDASNNATLSGIAGTDVLQFLASGGGITGLWDFINKSLDIRTTAVIINGTTNGTAELYMPFTGANFKVALLFFNNYRNASGASQAITLPVAFAQRANFWAGNGKPATPQSGGVDLTNKVNVVTTLASGGGTNTNVSPVPSNSFGEIFQTFSGFSLGTSQGTNASALYIFVGL